MVSCKQPLSYSFQTWVEIGHMTCKVKWCFLTVMSNQVK